MPKLTVQLNDPDDVRASRDLLIELDRRYSGEKTPAELAGEHPLPPDLAQGAPATSPTPPRRRGRPPASDGDASSSPTPEASAKQDFVVFDILGERRSGYANSADAATVLISYAKTLTTSADLSAFGKANLGTMARLAKEDGARVQIELGTHIAAVKKAEAENPPWEFEGPAQKPPMDRGTFVKEMTRLGGLLGAQEGKALLTELGFKEVSEIQDTDYERVVAACNARVEQLVTAKAA